MFVYIQNGSIVYKGDEEYQNGVVFSYDTVINTTYTKLDPIVYQDGVIKLYKPPENRDKKKYIPPTFQELQEERKREEGEDEEFESIRNKDVSLFINSNYA